MKKHILISLLLLGSLNAETNKDQNQSNLVKAYMPVKEKVLTTEYVKSFIENNFKDKIKKLDINLKDTQKTKYKNWNRNLYKYTISLKTNKKFTRTITLFCNDELKVCTSDFIGEGGVSLLSSMDMDIFKKSIETVEAKTIVEGDNMDNFFIFGNKDCKYTKEFTTHLEKYAKQNKKGLLYVEISENDFQKKIHFTNQLNIETIPAFFYKGKNITALIQKKFQTESN